MPELKIWLGRLFAFSLFALGLGYFSTSPSYTYHDPEKALVMISFSHASERQQACRKFTQAELNELAPNMRRPLDCPRARVPLLVQLSMDGEIVLEKFYQATGLASDGAASVYESIAVAAGEHEFSVKLRDSKRESGFDYMKTRKVTLGARQLLVIDFREELDGFIFQNGEQNGPG